ncbi:unnamed protein product [Protopolystoma xenopodis]|uniref:Uncharacterized protein n=1 Tax=Protopolystoma xenopodis TaxID=117903 RepID=A0A3S5A795_9PLAT|nr:unnamed protein product [Protopolystoma xenopodis]
MRSAPIKHKVVPQLSQHRNTIANNVFENNSSLVSTQISGPGTDSTSKPRRTSVPLRSAGISSAYKSVNHLSPSQARLSLGNEKSKHCTVSPHTKRLSRLCGDNDEQDRPHASSPNTASRQRVRLNETPTSGIPLCATGNTFNQMVLEESKGDECSGLTEIKHNLETSGKSCELSSAAITAIDITQMPCSHHGSSCIMSADLSGQVHVLPIIDPRLWPISTLHSMAQDERLKQRHFTVSLHLFSISNFFGMN